MGFFDFLHKHEEGEKSVEKPIIKINVNNVSDWLKSRLNKRMVRINEDAMKFHNDVIDTFSSIKNSVKDLSQASFEVDDKTYASVNMVKDSFVRKANNLLNSVQKISENNLNYTILKDFLSTIEGTIKELKEISPKQAIFLSNYFDKEGKAVIENVKEAEKYTNNLKRFLESDAKLMWLREEVDSKIKGKLEFMKQLDFLNGKSAKLEKEKKNLQKEEEEVRSKLTSLLKSREWLGLNKLNNEIESERKKSSEMELKIRNELSSIKRPLKKLSHAIDEGYRVSESKGLINNFIHKPFETIIIKGNELRLKEILSLIHKLVSEKRITLKPREYEKTLEMIRKLSTEIPWLIEKHEKTVKKEIDLKDKIEKASPEVLSNKRKLEDKIKNISQNVKNIDTEINDIKNDRKKIESDISNLKKDIEILIFENVKEKVEIVSN